MKSLNSHRRSSRKRHRVPVLWRVANDIQEVLYQSSAAQYLACSSLPSGRTIEATDCLERLTLATRSGDAFTARTLVQTLRGVVRDRLAGLEGVRQGLRCPGPRRPMFLAEIVRDLQALQGWAESEGCEIKFSRTPDKVWKVCLDTYSIELEDVDLGRFSASIRVDQIQDEDLSVIEVTARDPNCHAYKGNPHPHIEGEVLCFGIHDYPALSGLEEGRLSTLFVFIYLVLTSYNGSSAYVALEDWYGSRHCSDCGDTVSEDNAYYCEHGDCGTDLCPDCRVVCDHCGAVICPRHSQGASHGSEVYCDGCAIQCSGCGDTLCSKEAVEGVLGLGGGAAFGWYCGNCYTECPECQALYLTGLQQCPLCEEQDDEEEEDEQDGDATPEPAPDDEARDPFADLADRLHAHPASQTPRGAP